jgi:hypothetical protein
VRLSLSLSLSYSSQWLSVACPRPHASLTTSSLRAGLRLGVTASAAGSRAAAAPPSTTTPAAATTLPSPPAVTPGATHPAAHPWYAPPTPSGSEPPSKTNAERRDAKNAA